MSRLTEKFVQQKALEKLSSYYSAKFNTPVFFAKQEVRTTKSYGDKRADGVLCFNSSLQDNHLVSIEAKSHKTLGAILPYWNDKKIGVQTTIFALVVIFVVAYITFNLDWYWILIIAIGAAVLATLIYIIFISLFEPHGLKVVNVVSQVNQYPANEKWIAISVDSFNLSDKRANGFYNKDNSQILRNTCKKEGIGLLLVSKRDQRIEFEPSFKKGTFTNCYCRAGEMTTISK